LEKSNAKPFASNTVRKTVPNMATKIQIIALDLTFSFRKIKPRTRMNIGCVFASTVAAETVVKRKD
jgi:hypothetical protein